MVSSPVDTVCDIHNYVHVYNTLRVKSRYSKGHLFKSSLTYSGTE